MRGPFYGTETDLEFIRRFVIVSVFGDFFCRAAAVGAAGLAGFFIFRCRTQLVHIHYRLAADAAMRQLFDFFRSQFDGNILGASFFGNFTFVVRITRI